MVAGGKLLSKNQINRPAPEDKLTRILTCRCDPALARRARRRSSDGADLSAENGLTTHCRAATRATAKAIADDGLVAEARIVFHPALTMVSLTSCFHWRTAVRLHCNVIRPIPRVPIRFPWPETFAGLAAAPTTLASRARAAS